MTSEGHASAINHIRADRIKPTIRKAGTVGLASGSSIAPLRQGELDCFCGVYSAINALRLLMKEHTPLSPLDCSILFSASTSRIAKKNGLHESLVGGLDLRRRLAIVRHIAALASNATDTFTVERPDTRRWVMADAFGWIEQSLSVGKPVLLRLIGPAIDHFTVIAASTPTTLQLFDSGDRRYVRKDSCSLRAGTNVIPPHSILRLALSRQD